jgi:hypothetical protein
MDLLIFPEEAEFLKVEQSKDRVFVLAFKSSSQKHFFWMQEPQGDKDEEFCSKINKAISDPISLAQDSGASPSSAQGMGSDQEQLLRLLQQSMVRYVVCG